MTSSGHYRILILATTVSLVISQCSDSIYSPECPPCPIPPVPCPNKPPCREPPCLPDNCPGANKGMNECSCGRRRFKRDATSEGRGENDSKGTEGPNRKLREVAHVEFDSFIDRVSVIKNIDEHCNSEKLRTILKQSMTKNATESVQTIIDQIHDDDFIVNCTVKSKPIVDRRSVYCEHTIGLTTCVATTGKLLQRPDPITSLNASEFFRPEIKTLNESSDESNATSTQTETTSTIGPTPPPIESVTKRRGEGYGRR